MDRRVRRLLSGRMTMEGAGVRLKRIFGPSEVPLFDPFLLLDNFGSEDPADYVKGFPWHPHRGIETVTYMLSGEVEHGDSLGNSGVIGSGDIQWMTAGSGIIHQEMPKRHVGLMRGFQLWVNLPAKRKMTAPKYRGITGDQIPVSRESGIEVKAIAGIVNGTIGVVKDLSAKVEYFDVKLDPGKTFEHETERGSIVFILAIDGSGYSNGSLIETQNCALFGEGDSVRVETKEGFRFLFASGEPLNEPVAWGGPIVMNTQKELDKAFQELNEGTFIKDGKTLNSHRDFYQAPH